jgi:hypothetical protein
LVAGCALQLLLAICAGCGDAWLEANGTVCDPQGAPIAGATITLAPAPDFKDARFVRSESTMSDDQGKFTIHSGTFAPYSNPRFTLTIEKQGLKSYETRLTRDAVDLTIELAPVPEGERAHGQRVETVPNPRPASDH